MYVNEPLILLIAGFLAIVLVVLRSVHLLPERMSAFELERRINQDDPFAHLVKSRIEITPRLLALRRILDVFLVVGIVLVMIVSLGLWVGAFASLLLFLLVDMAAVNQGIKRFTRKYFNTVEPAITSRIANWKWLDYFNIFTVEQANVTIESKPELVDLIGRTHGVLSKEEIKRLHSTLAFGDIVVKDVMTPKSMIESIDQREAIGPLVMDQLHKTGHSRFPVIDGDIDHVVGMLYLHDLISTLNTSHKTAKSAMQQQVYYVREDDSLEHSLHAFLRTHHHLFIVVNEFRETVGLLSLEDVIESLLGYQVVDEFDEYDDIRKVAEKNPHKRNEPKGKINL